MKKYPYLNDEVFLKEFDLQRLKEKYVKIIVLDLLENPIEDIVGKAIGGNINIDGRSSIRRTANINMISTDKNNDITKTQNLLSINKKVQLEIGFKNISDKYKEYPIIWFPAGVYVIIQVSLSHSLSGVNISLRLKDKMCLLNGECGGILPASITFNEIETIDEKGNWIVKYPTIFQIITEAVNHWGGEQLGKILISDIEPRIRRVMRWNGSLPVYCYNEGNGVEFTTSESKIEELEIAGYTLTTNPEALFTSESYIKYIKGQNVGFIFDDFCYVDGDLVGEAGSSVCDLLDKIKNFLGNYEYFYDLDGNFIFREIKNFLNKSHAQVVLDEINNSDYLINKINSKIVYDFNNSTLVSSYNNNPQYNKIKNDFVVWGVRKDLEDNEIPIRFHLAIDKKPIPDKNGYQVFKYKDTEDGLVKAKSALEISSLDQLPQPGIIGNFYLVETDNQIYTWNNDLQEYQKVKDAKVINVIAKDWRTELYLQGVIAEPLGLSSNYYYMELQNEWPKLYDIWSDNQAFFPQVLADPSGQDFFLDFIDSSAEIGEFSISNIGRRTKVIVDNNVNCLFEPEIPDLIILEKSGKNIEKERAECEARGLRYTQVEQSIFSNLSGGRSYNAAYDLIRELLYEYTNYNESITMQTVPIYHLDVNSRVSITDHLSNIKGDYIINTISLPLDLNGLMSISAGKALQRI